MSKYLIGILPSLFLLLIACFARATPIDQRQDPMSLHSSAATQLASSFATLPEQQAAVK